MLRPLLVSFGFLAALTGLVYPLGFTAAAQVLFPEQARGSLITLQGQVRGSRLIAQATEDPRYFWSRPSATGVFPTNAGASGGSCLAPSNPSLAEGVRQRIQHLQASDPENRVPIPQDLVTASASGLDPHLSPEGARWQIRRVAKARGMAPEALQALIDRHSSGGAFTPVRVNVMELNLALDAIAGR